MVQDLAWIWDEVSALTVVNYGVDYSLDIKGHSRRFMYIQNLGPQWWYS